MWGLSMTKSETVVRREDRGNVAVILIDNPPVNATSAAVRAALMTELAKAASDPAVDAIVLAGAGTTFVAGADITEFGKPRPPPTLPEICASIESCAKPVVAAVHGNALGAGMELALAAHARLATRDAMVGLPEVTLGIIPGAGGTQRLPRLCGIVGAMEIVSTGRRIAAPEALRLGILDMIVEGDLLDIAIGHARGLIGKPVRRIGDMPFPAFDPDEARTMLDGIRRKARGQTSPSRAAEAVLAGASLPFTEALLAERAIFTSLVDSEQAAALRHIFFAERAARHVAGLEGVSPKPVKTVGVAGGGTMGSGIVVALADAGYNVVLLEQNADAAEAGRRRVAALYDRAVKSKRLDQEAASKRLALVSIASTVSALAPCDLVIEAVFDDLPVKQAIFAALSRIVRPDAILATNTSYLDPNVIAQSVDRPENLVGMHFFAPANVMRLLEVVHTAKAAPEALATAIAVARNLRKLPIVSGVCEGFIGNRIYSSYRAQAEYLLEEGALPHEIDAAIEAFGLPMGPFSVFDLSGLDIAWARRKRLAPARDPRQRYVEIPDRLCEMGRFGQKTGAGWYRYVEGKKTIDPEVTTLIEAASREKGIVRRTFTRQEITGRLVAAMVNEGCKVVSEKIAARSSDIDLVYVNGYGWPPWLGGPMFQGDRLGARAVLAEIRQMERRDGPGWEPAPAIVEAAGSGQSLAETLSRV